MKNTPEDKKKSKGKEKNGEGVLDGPIFIEDKEPERRAVWVGLVKLLRPHQWVKNLFVVAPLVFSKKMTESDLLFLSLGAFFLFCLSSGFVYVFNDLKDIEADRRHPVKRKRPLASGQVSKNAGKVLAWVLAVVSLVGGWSLGKWFGAFLTGYLVLNLFYTLILKRIPYLEVVCIATGFLLRVLAGAAVVSVEPSIWLIVCTGLLAGYLGLGKRTFELRVLGKDASKHRAVLAKYRKKHLNIALVLCGVATFIAYILYTRSPHTVAFFETKNLIWTAPFPAFGLFRFGVLLFRGAAQESPTEEMLKDPFFLINMGLWAASVLGIIYVY